MDTHYKSIHIFHSYLIHLEINIRKAQALALKHYQSIPGDLWAPPKVFFKCQKRRSRVGLTIYRRTFMQPGLHRTPFGGAYSASPEPVLAACCSAPKKPHSRTRGLTLVGEVGDQNFHWLVPETTL